MYEHNDREIEDGDGKKKKKAKKNEENKTIY